MNRYSIARFGLLCVVAAGAPVGCQSQEPSKKQIESNVLAHEPAIPSGLEVNGFPMLTVHAQGVQIYVLANGPDGKPAWKLKAPDATFSGPGIEGKHYAGPTWESATDGSKVVGRKLAEHASPDPNAVGWLLLEAKGHEGSGALSKVTFIQRINTSGGTAPTVEGAKIEDEVKVPYRADYVFYGPGATTRP